VYCSPAIRLLSTHYLVNGVRTPAAEVTPHLRSEGSSDGDIRMIRLDTLTRLATLGTEYVLSE